jgi:hypothetical protein
MKNWLTKMISDTEGSKTLGFAWSLSCGDSSLFGQEDEQSDLKNAHDDQFLQPLRLYRGNGTLWDEQTSYA